MAPQSVANPEVPRIVIAALIRVSAKNRAVMPVPHIPRYEVVPQITLSEKARRWLLGG
jgi:hypothetical protein